MAIIANARLAVSTAESRKNDLRSGGPVLRLQSPILLKRNFGLSTVRGPRCRIVTNILKKRPHCFLLCRIEQLESLKNVPLQRLARIAKVRDHAAREPCLCD